MKERVGDGCVSVCSKSVSKKGAFVQEQGVEATSEVEWQVRGRKGLVNSLTN